MIGRREFITLLGGSAAWPLRAGAQQTIPVIAVLSGRTNRYPAFQKGVAETGYIEGRNVHIEFHSVEGHYDQLPSRARELVSRPVTVIAPMGIEAAQAAKDESLRFRLCLFSELIRSRLDLFWSNKTRKQYQG